MKKVVERTGGNIEIKTCVYRDDYFYLVDVSGEMAESNLFAKAVYADVLNINALYKYFVDDNFEYHHEVQDHFIQEKMDEQGNIHISMGSLDASGKKLKTHYLTLRYKDFSE